MDNPLVSICMSYKDRERQLTFTLDTIIQSIHKNIEIIIVDDGSKKCVDKIMKSSNIKYKLIKIKEKEKWWINPCIPYNIAIKQSKGDIIILQNPECCHVGDVVNYCVNNIKDNEYFSFCCYCLNQTLSRRLRKKGTNFFNSINRFNGNGFQDGSGWYQHPIYRPLKYHFLSCFNRKTASVIKGFNEHFAAGMGYDDDELVYRIEKSGIEIKQISENDPMVVHQWHDRPNYRKMNNLFTINRILYEEIKKKDKTILEQ